MQKGTQKGKQKGKQKGTQKGTQKGKQKGRLPGRGSPGTDLNNSGPRPREQPRHGATDSECEHEQIQEQP